MDTLPYSLVMIVGLPRSGTTLLQVALADQTGVVTAHETHLFDVYLGPMFNRYRAEEQDFRSADGIRHLISSEALRGVFRNFSTSILSSIHSKNPAATVVLEKTPGHLMHMPLIKACLPEVKFIHIIRDPRGVAASLKAVAQEQWGYWASKDVAAVAREWARGVSVGIDQAPQLGAAYTEVRYEDLFVRGNEIMRTLCEWLGLPIDHSFPNDIRDRFPIATMARGSGDVTDPRNEDRKHFFRRGEPASWREELSIVEIATIEEICDQTMQRAGYAPCVIRMDAFI